MACKDHSRVSEYDQSVYFRSASTESREWATRIFYFVCLANTVIEVFNKDTLGLVWRGVRGNRYHYERINEDAHLGSRVPRYIWSSLDRLSGTLGPRDGHRGRDRFQNSPQEALGGIRVCV
jgi:hypothetical protein